MIERINEQVAYNPVREHISVGFDTVPDGEQIETIVHDLLEQGFDSVLSRVLVFVRTRANAEETVEGIIDCLKKKSISWADKVGFFHAGMDSVSREEVYEEFEKGDKVILVATKAFGMGMDIPNIHYVYHLGPSSTFEDFLQEVGRAGRNKEKLHEAGFSNEKPIRTKCIMTNSDFRYLKDLNHKSAISWNHIKSVQKAVFDFISKFKPAVPDPEEPFPLPFDLLNSYPEFEDEFDADSLFRLALYWLERLGRIRLGLFTPAFLPVSIPASKADITIIQDLEEREAIQKFVASVKSYQAAKFPEGSAALIPMPDIRQFSGKKNNAELFKFLFMAQKAGAISIDRFITLEPTRTRTRELEKWTKFTSAPTIEAIFDLTEKILNKTKLCEQVSFAGDFIDSLARETAEEYFSPRQIFWEEFKKNGKEEIPATEISEKLKEDFIKKRVKFAFKIITMLPKMRHQSIIEAGTDRKKPKVVQLVYNGNTNKKTLIQALNEFKNKLNELIFHVAPTFFQENEKSFNYADLIIRLKLDDHPFEYLPSLIFISKGLGYLKGNGSFIPMGIELFIDDVSDIDERDRATQDYKVYQDFLEGIQLKELRLLALECLATLSSAQQDAFIKKYFSCSDISELVNLLEEHFGEDHENLRAFRKEALAKAEDQLNDEQKAVYEAPLDTNLQVIAGPGSGKTHSLTLRVARLIQKEQVSPEQILVLAYNRAVVVELKHRLTKLFRDLGYAKLISRLKVFTFHGFCMHCLGKDLEGVDFDSWVQKFLDELKNNPGKISQKLGQVKYVFVDEFQDITNKRLELLEKIANPERTKICVIGDPNQSIYGYQRIIESESGAMSPKPYYRAFQQVYKADVLYLTTNYRSLPEILKAAEDFLKSEFKIPKLKANRQPETDIEYCEILNVKEGNLNWRDKLQEMLEEQYEPGKQYRQVAIMYRSNEEVFRAFNELQALDLKGVRVRIQGASTSPFRSREFFYFILAFRKVSTKIIPSDFIEIFEKVKVKILSKHKNWDSYLINLFHCILLEFLVEKSEGSTYQDLIEFIEDISGKDDGHFSKIFEKHIQDIDPSFSLREVIITTMHKVKGVEFDAVLLPPSFSDFASRENVASKNFRELLDEERRLLYVAYTRARYRLVVLKFDRELAIDEGKSYALPEALKRKLGVVVPLEIDKLFISWGAKESNSSTFSTIQDKVSIGDPVELVKDNFGGWTVKWNNIQIGKLKSNQLSQAIQDRRLKGFNISSIVSYTHSESVDYDVRNNTTFTAKNWGHSAIARGYIYLVDFSGYGKA
jgi:superfamily I DNA/RNA helicase